ncbi:MAG: RCC1 domain-containing protein [Polyangiales bacterium]
MNQERKTGDARRWCILAASLALMAMNGCQSERKTATVVVQLQTDLVPIEEFDHVELSLWSLDDEHQAQRLDVPIVATQSFYPAAPLGELGDVAHGDYRLNVLLRNQTLGRTVSERPVLLSIRANLAVSVPINRSCLNVYCPEGQACFGGSCVDPRCSLEQIAWCGSTRQCDADTECQPAASCAMGECQQGVCWAVPRPTQDAASCDPQTQWCHPEDQCISRTGIAPPVSAPAAASCFDGVQNGTETGIDCGGTCGACTVTIVRMKATRQFTCVRRSDGTMRCWGRNLNAQITGDGSTASPQRSPIAPQTGFTGPIHAMAVANAHSCAVSSTGQAHCWGGLGASGDGAATPTVIHDATDLTDIMGSKNYSCGVTSGGTVRCWGLGYFGGATASAVTIAGVSDVRELGLGDDHACALQGDGTVSCWGDNSHGQLGDGTGTPSSTPVTVSGISDAIAIAASRWYSCAIRTSGTVSCWGRNDQGQLGDGTSDPSNLPVTVLGLSDATHISAGDDHICARTHAGALHCWGRDYGSTPQQVYSVGVALPSMGERFSCVLMDDRVTVQCWGANAFGECGPGVAGSSVPTPNSFTVP